MYWKQQTVALRPVCFASYLQINGLLSLQSLICLLFLSAQCQQHLAFRVHACSHTHTYTQTHTPACLNSTLNKKTNISSHLSCQNQDFKLRRQSRFYLLGKLCRHVLLCACAYNWDNRRKVSPGGQKSKLFFSWTSRAGKLAKAERAGYTGGWW